MWISYGNQLAIGEDLELFDMLLQETQTPLLFLSDIISLESMPLVVRVTSHIIPAILQREKDLQNPSNTAIYQLDDVHCNTIIVYSLAHVFVHNNINYFPILCGEHIFFPLNKENCISIRDEWKYALESPHWIGLNDPNNPKVLSLLYFEMTSTKDWETIENAYIHDIQL